MPWFKVTLEELASFDYLVEATDKTAAGEAAEEMFTQGKGAGTISVHSREVSNVVPHHDPYPVGTKVLGRCRVFGGTGETGEEVTVKPGWSGAIDLVDENGYHVTIQVPGRPDPDDTIVNVFDFLEAESILEIVGEAEKAT